MITREQLLDELKTAAEPEKQLHRIAQREKLPVHVLRKMVKRPDLVLVAEPERHIPLDRPQNQSRIIWSEREVRYAVNAFRRGNSLAHIAFELEIGRDTVRRKLMIELGTEYKKIARENVARVRQRREREWTESDIARLKEYWKSGITQKDICARLDRKWNDLHRFVLENPGVVERRGRR